MGTSKRKAIGITRVSVEGTREEGRLYSYDTQADAIGADCEREGVDLLYVGKERAVSGGANLDNRPELLRAIEAVERGEATVIVAAYFDRFFRSLAVQAQVIERVERAGGELLALDHGRLTNGTAAERLQANVLGSISQFYREQSREKSHEGQKAAVARGAIPWARVALGYARRDDGTYEPNPAEVALVNECFQLRLDGASHMTIRRALQDRGVVRSVRGVQQLLGNRVYVGEIHFGSLVNLDAHEAIVDRDIFDRVQRMKIPRGKQPRSERLLARLKIMRCGTCGSPLGTMKMPRQGDYQIYRCGSHNDCEGHVTIAAEPVERWVWERVKENLADDEGHAVAGDTERRLAAERDDAQARLDRAVRSLAASGLLDEAASVETLGALRADRDAKRSAVDRLPPDTSRVRRLRVDDEMPFDVRRDLIRTLVKTVTVARSGPGQPRGTDRLVIEFFG